MAEDTFLSRVERMLNDMMAPPPKKNPKGKVAGRGNYNPVSRVTKKDLERVPMDGGDEDEDEGYSPVSKVGKRDLQRVSMDDGGVGYSPVSKVGKRDLQSVPMDGGDGGRGVSDEDMEAAMQAIEYRRNRKPSGADIEAAMQTAAEMEDGDDEYSPVSAVTKADLERGKPLEVQGGMRRVVAETEKGTGEMLTKKPEGDLGDRTGFQPKAKLVAEDELMQSFFAKAHGGSFDPKSRVDKAKMQKILDMVNTDPKLLSLSPGKFAVKLYASK
jgi:hypothetical protein